MNTSAAAVAGFGVRPPFTAAQWQELEHQALIYKYLTAGVPVPPELLIPIRRSFEALPGRYWHHPALAYCSYYGKKLDPEPGRCRRTDGKKWRCSKDAHPDSKYCERHMHRGRNRSRKPVESQSQSQSQSASQLQSSSTTVTAASSSGAGGSGGGNSQSINPQHSVASHVNAQSLCLGGSSLTQLSMDTGPFANRYFSGVKPGVDEHSFFLETTGNARNLVLDSVDSSWCLTPSRVPSFPLLKTREPSSLLQSSYPQLQSLQDNIGQVTGSSTSRQQQQQQQQQSFMSSEFGSTEPKHESQFLRPFFDEWPKARDSWSDIEEDRSNRTSFSTTQLSMSFPMASSSDFSTTSSRSPNDD